jgi:hypothetical protein
VVAALIDRDEWHCEQAANTPDVSARHDHVEVRMVGEGRAPGVEDGEHEMRAPRCLGSAAMVIRVPAEALNRMS